MKTESYSDSVEIFVESFTTGIDMAKVLISELEDMLFYISTFHKRNKYQIDDLLDYRDYKVSNSNATIEQFRLDFDSSLENKKLFEQTFYQSFSDDDITIIESALTSGRVTLDIIFQGFKSNPSKNIMKYVL